MGAYSRLLGWKANLVWQMPCPFQSPCEITVYMAAGAGGVTQDLWQIPLYVKVLCGHSLSTLNRY